MSRSFVPATGWGPEGKTAALCITFDNFGEAVHLELGTWGEQPVGDHVSVRFLPELIDALGSVKTTYFVEGSNAEIYPEQLKLWQRAGHEIAIHAWRHEVWANAAPHERRTMLARSIAAMRGIGVEPVGFRPPGGSIDEEAWAEFADAGLLYCSDSSGGNIRKIGPVFAAPFHWPDVDVFMIEPDLGFMRQRLGMQEAPFGVDIWEQHLNSVLDEIITGNAQRTLIFHPEFLAQSHTKMKVLSDLINRAQREDVWVAPVRDVINFVKDNQLTQYFPA